MSREMTGSPTTGSDAYYYHYDVTSGDWCENAHRVPVQWHRQWVPMPPLGGLRLKAFGRVEQGKTEVIRLARLDLQCRSV